MAGQEPQNQGRKESIKKLFRLVESNTSWSPMSWKGMVYEQKWSLPMDYKGVSAFKTVVDEDSTYK